MRRNILRKIDIFLTMAIITILLPLFITTIGQRMQLEELIYGQGGTSMDEVEEQLIGIVAKEISADAEREAILAQCVIARTTLCEAKEKKTAEPEGITVDEMKNLWGEQFELCYGQIESCVEETQGEVLLWEEEYVYAPYHAISAGSTRDISEMYQEVKMPYLKIQACEKDAVAEGYLAVSYWEKEEFVAECIRLFPESAVATYEDIIIEKRDAAGYVLQIKVGVTTCEGEAFREAFGLASSHFTIVLVDDKVRIVTKGLGHGFGLSQNTANEMARQGDGYETILAYFFPGTELKKLSDEK